MPREEPPKGPPPPEYGAPSRRTLIIALIGFLCAEIKRDHEKHKDAQLLLRAPVKYIHGAFSSHPLPRLTLADDYDRLSLITSTCGDLRELLNTNLEKKEWHHGKYPEDQWMLASLNKAIREGLKEGEIISSFIGFAVTLNDHLKSNGALATLESIKHPLANENFTKTFGYDAVVQGLKDEVLALLPELEDLDHPPLYLGMAVYYRKILPPSGHTGPLSGTGKIVAFSLHALEGGVISDQVIRLEIQTEQETVFSWFSTKEISLMPPPAS